MKFTVLDYVGNPKTPDGKESVNHLEHRMAQALIQGFYAKHGRLPVPPQAERAALLVIAKKPPGAGSPSPKRHRTTTIRK